MSFFKEVLEELPLTTKLTIVHDGEQLIEELNKKESTLPDVLFLDLNMPRKNGFECLEEIKKNKKLKNIPIIIISTSLDQTVVNRLYQGGAQYFIRKPSDISYFPKIILRALTPTTQGNTSQPTRENFVVTF